MESKESPEREWCARSRAQHPPHAPPQLLNRQTRGACSILLIVGKNSSSKDRVKSPSVFSGHSFLAEGLKTQLDGDLSRADLLREELRWQKQRLDPAAQQDRYLPAPWQGTRCLEASTCSLLLLCNGISW